MKHFNSFSRALCLAAFIIMTASAHAQTFPSQGAHMDSVEISLLTCSPGNEVWSLYGHSAIRIQDKSNGEDVAVNYGLFDYNQKNFIIRFIFGLTDYSVGIAPFPMFLTEYARQGRTVVQQRLNLSPEEKLTSSKLSPKTARQQIEFTDITTFMTIAPQGHATCLSII